MNKFRFRYTPLVWTLLAVVLALSVAGLIWNIYNIASFYYDDTLKTVLYFIVTALNLALVLFALSLLIYVKYEITDEYLYLRFGFIATKTPIKSIVQVSHYKKSDKLVVFFADAKYTVAVISPKSYDAFTRLIKEKNPAVIITDESENPDTTQQI